MRTFTSNPTRRAVLAGLGSAIVGRGQQFPLTYAGPGRHIVLVGGDQEYRSEESVPALARILSQRHGFRCTLVLPITRETGEIDPSQIHDLPGVEALRTADLMILFARWLELPDAQMKQIIDYTNSGRPILGLRTATHPFNYSRTSESPYSRYSWRSTDPPGGYGRLVFGETWVAHYGAHQKQSTRGVPAPGQENHPLLRGVRNVWGPSDVYALTTLAGDCVPLMLGEVLDGMTPDAPPDPTKKLLPVAWTKTFTGASGKAARVFMTTMGHAEDFRNEGFRRMVVNGCYWALGKEKDIEAGSNVAFVGPYEPSPIGEGKYRRGVRLSTLR